MGMAIHGDLAFVHRFQQRGLGLGRGAVDLIGQQDVGEDGTALELEALVCGRVHGDAEDVTGQHVAGKLHPPEIAVDGARKSVGESGFANPGNAFNQQMSAGKNRHQGQADDLVLATDDGAQSTLQFSCALQG